MAQVPHYFLEFLSVKLKNNNNNNFIKKNKKAITVYLQWPLRNSRSVL